MSLPLHPEKGVNPRLMVCIQCGADIGVVLLGKLENVWMCCGCDMQYIQAEEPKKCKICPSGQFTKRVLRDNEKVAIGLCSACDEKRKEVEQVVEEGGIYWRCTDCKSEGAIRGSAPLAQAVREQMKIPAPKLCGVEFSKEDCPVCSPEALKEKEKDDEKSS